MDSGWRKGEATGVDAGRCVHGVGFHTSDSIARAVSSLAFMLTLPVVAGAMLGDVGAVSASRVRQSRKSGQIKIGSERN